VTRTCVLERSTRDCDRVEIAPEDLAKAALEAETLSAHYGRTLRVIGWYHSHPHITVQPSHVDVRTQAHYQLMDPQFVGLILSCFSGSSSSSVQAFNLIAFQSGMAPPHAASEHIPVYAGASIRSLKEADEWEVMEEHLSVGKTQVRQTLVCRLSLSFFFFFFLFCFF
jgi:hypothetical protein